MTIRVEHHHFIHADCDDKALLHQIIKKLNAMPTKEEFQAAFTDLGDALNNIADDITRLTDQLVQGGLSAADEQGVFDQLRTLADKAKALAAQTVDPVPPTPEA